MQPFDFVQFRIPAGNLSAIYEKDFDVQEVLENEMFMAALKEATPNFFEITT